MLRNRSCDVTLQVRNEGAETNCVERQFSCVKQKDVRKCDPARISPLKIGNFLIFSNFTEVFHFFNNVKNAEEKSSVSPPQKRRRPKKYFFCSFFLFLTKLLVTGSPKFAQVVSHQ